MDRSKSPANGEQQGAAWSGHFQSKCLHPLLAFNLFGDLERCDRRRGNIHSAEGWLTHLTRGNCACSLTVIRSKAMRQP